MMKMKILLMNKFIKLKIKSRFGFKNMVCQELKKYSNVKRTTLSSLQMIDENENENSHKK